MNETFRLDDVRIPGDIKPGFVMLRVPVLVRPESQFGAIQVSVNADAYNKGMLKVHVVGQPGAPERVEVTREDMPDKSIQIEAPISLGEGVERRAVLAQPVGDLVLLRTESGDWEAQAEGLEVENEFGMNDFANAILSFAARKQNKPNLSRPAHAEPEL